MDAEIYYSQVDDEIAAGKRDLELWARALEASGGDEEKAKTDYRQWRFEQVRAEAEDDVPPRLLSSTANPSDKSTDWYSWAGLLIVLLGLFLLTQPGFPDNKLFTGVVVLMALSGLGYRASQARKTPAAPHPPERPAQDGDLPVPQGLRVSGSFRVVQCFACADSLRIPLDQHEIFRCPHCGVKQFPPRTSPA